MYHGLTATKRRERYGEEGGLTSQSPSPPSSRVSSPPPLPALKALRSDGVAVSRSSPGSPFCRQRPCSPSASLNRSLFPDRPAACSAHVHRGVGSNAGVPAADRKGARPGTWIFSLAASRVSVDLRSLGAARVLVALVILLELYQRSHDPIFPFGPDCAGQPQRPGCASMLHPSRLDDATSSVSWLGGPPVVQRALFLVHLLASMALLLGWRTQASTVVLWLLTRRDTLLDGPLARAGPGPTLQGLLFWCMWLPWGRHFTWTPPFPRRAPHHPLGSLQPRHRSHDGHASDYASGPHAGQHADVSSSYPWSHLAAHGMLCAPASHRAGENRETVPAAHDVPAMGEARAQDTWQRGIGGGAYEEAGRGGHGRGATAGHARDGVPSDSGPWEWPQGKSPAHVPTNPNPGTITTACLATGAASWASAGLLLQLILAHVAPTCGPLGALCQHTFWFLPSGALMPPAWLLGGYAVGPLGQWLGVTAAGLGSTVHGGSSSATSAVTWALSALTIAHHAWAMVAVWLLAPASAGALRMCALLPLMLLHVTLLGLTHAITGQLAAIAWVLALMPATVWVLVAKCSRRLWDQVPRILKHGCGGRLPLWPPMKHRGWLPLWPTEGMEHQGWLLPMASAGGLKGGTLLEEGHRGAEGTAWHRMWRGGAGSRFLGLVRRVVIHLMPALCVACLVYSQLRGGDRCCVAVGGSGDAADRGNGRSMSALIPAGGCHRIICPYVGQLARGQACGGAGGRWLASCKVSGRSAPTSLSWHNRWASAVQHGVVPPPSSWTSSCSFTHSCMRKKKEGGSARSTCSPP
eukprot:jgi/Mesvir1/24958/Mv16929-RA.2